MAKSTTQPTSDIPKISGPANDALTVAGYTQLKQLTQVTEAELLALHGFGPKGLKILRSAMESCGLSFAAPRKNR